LTVDDERDPDSFYEALRDDDPEKLYELAPFGYLSVAPGGEILKVNQTLVSWLGRTKAELVSRLTFADLLSPGGRIYYETHLGPMLQLQESVREVALEMVTTSGRRLPVLVNAATERDPSGRPVVVRLAVLDATHRMRYERQLREARLRAEESEAYAHDLARTLQQTLIPPTPPSIPDLDVAAAYRPAGDGQEVGGDFYDVFQIGEGDWVVVIGDICGKGVGAAVVTAVVRHSVRALTVRLREPSKVLASLNQVLLQHETDRFCTVMLLRLRRVDETWVVSMSAAGHPLPLLAQAGGVVRPVGQTGSLLGIVEEPEFRDSRVRLGRGDVLVVYTDGITEARRDDQFYGEERLRASLSAHLGSAQTITNGVVRDVVDFQRGICRDDIALVALCVPE
jgi:sigma-B regulation protein RsbU (phosphoserine phosphatase)